MTTDHIDNVIRHFVKHRIGGVIVISRDEKLLYKDDRIVLSDKSFDAFMLRRPDFDEVRKSWEFADPENGKYYRIETAMVSEDSEDFQCHHFTDVSDYATLFQDISDFYRQTSDISSFQSNIMGKLNEPYENCLADISTFCNSPKAILYVEDEEGVNRISFSNNTYKKKSVALTDNLKELIHCKRFDLVNGNYCFLSDDMSGKHCTLFLQRSEDFHEDYFKDLSVYNVIRLYIENGLLRERIIYESEHDALTGLFNKGKFLTLLAERFASPERITIFNFDVNNLKLTNDNDGHEAGDQLIMRAADSIRCMEKEDALCFRVGGDEFIAVLCDATLAKSEEVRALWENTLQAQRGDKPLTIACGMAYGEGNYNIDDLMTQADQKMYENKKMLKEREVA